MVYKLESRYDIQSWRYFANKVIPNLYEKTRANVELELKKMKNGTFSCSFFEEENVSAAVAHIEINIFYVISHEKVIM